MGSQLPGDEIVEGVMCLALSRNWIGAISEESTRYSLMGVKRVADSPKAG